MIQPPAKNACLPPWEHTMAIMQAVDSLIELTNSAESKEKIPCFQIQDGNDADELLEE